MPFCNNKNLLLFCRIMTNNEILSIPSRIGDLNKS